jgi:hypothetical protein
MLFCNYLYFINIKSKKPDLARLLLNLWHGGVGSKVLG